MSFYEKNWKPLKLKQIEYPTGKGMATYGHGPDWYNKLLIRTTDRKTRLERYNAMDVTIDINRALDVIAEDISSEGGASNETFELNFPEDSNPSKSQLKTLTQTLELWENATEFDYRFFDYIRETIKYGVVLFLVGKKGELKKLIQERIEGYQLDAEDNSIVTHYLYNHTGAFKNENGDVVYPPYTMNKDNLQMIPVDDIFMLKIGEGAYGESILDRVYRVWRQLQLLEDSVVIYRIVRAPERRVFYIDIGNLPAHKSEAYLEQVKNKLRQKQMLRNGAVETEYNPASMQEDFIIGQSGDGRGSKVETLPGGDNLGEIADLQHFNKKLALGLRIPPSYLDTYSEGEGSTFNDGKVGTAYIAELRYVGYVKRLQKTIAKSLHTNFANYCKKNDVEVPEEMKLEISPPQSFAEYKENELYSILLNTYSSAEATSTLSKRYSMEKFLRMSKDDLVTNENYKLQELGLDESQIKSLTEEQRMNILYGDGSINPHTPGVGATSEGMGMGMEEEIPEEVPEEEFDSEADAVDLTSDEEEPAPKKTKKKK